MNDDEIKIQEILKEVANAGEVPGFAVEQILEILAKEKESGSYDAWGDTKDIEEELLNTPIEDWRKRAVLSAKIISRRLE